MDYLPLGNTGLYVSRLCFGAMTFVDPKQTQYSWLGNEGQDTANEMVSISLDAGINFFDTANVYAEGQSEIMLGKALGDRRQDVVVATKVCLPMGRGVNRTGNSRVAIMRELEDSLTRLGTDYIDLYQLHEWDHTTPIEETLRALDDCVKQGKVRYIGLANSTAWQIAKAYGIAERLGTEKFCSLQCYYSLVGRDLEQDILPAVQDCGMGTMIYSPLSAGFLTGKYTGENAEKGRRSTIDYPPIDMQQGDKIVEVLREIGAAHGRPAGQVALSWLLHQSGVTSVIVGARNVSQLNDNLGAIDIQLSDEQLKQLDEVSAKAPLYPHWVPTPSRGGNMNEMLDASNEVSK